MCPQKRIVHVRKRVVQYWSTKLNTLISAVLSVVFFFLLRSLIYKFQHLQLGAVNCRLPTVPHLLLIYYHTPLTSSMLMSNVNFCDSFSILTRGLKRRTCVINLCAFYLSCSPGSLVLDKVKPNGVPRAAFRGVQPH